MMVNAAHLPEEFFDLTSNVVQPAPTFGIFRRSPWSPMPESIRRGPSAGPMSRPSPTPWEQVSFTGDDEPEPGLRLHRSTRPGAVLMFARSEGSSLALCGRHDARTPGLFAVEEKGPDWWFDEDEPIELVSAGCSCATAVDLRFSPARVLRRVPAVEAADYFSHTWAAE